MTEIEDPTVTLTRLLDKNIRVVNDEGSLANICVSPEWVDREPLKNVDGQVTVGLESSEDQKLDLSATLRRRVGYERIKIWVSDKAGFDGRKVRNKLRQEVNRVIREKRTKPNETVYNYVNVGSDTEGNGAYYAESASELTPENPAWAEFSASDYKKLWQSDEDKFSFSQSEDGSYSQLLFRLKVESNKKTVKKIALKFEGYATSPSGNGVTVKVWNSQASEWQNSQTGTGAGDEELTIVLEASVSDFVDSNGYVFLLARSLYPSNGASAAVVFCDVVDCLVAVEGICYVDVVSYRDTDELRVKPVVWCTLFVVKTWLFEDVTVT